MNFPCTESANPIPWCDQQRSGGDQFFATRIDREAEAFETAGAEQKQIAFFGEHHLVYGERLFNANNGEADAARNALMSSFFSRTIWLSNNGEADAARNALAVGHHEFDVLFLTRNADFFERGSRRPCVFTAGIDQHARQLYAARAIHRILDLAAYRKCAHRFTSLRIASDIGYRGDVTPDDLPRVDSRARIAHLPRARRIAVHDLREPGRLLYRQVGGLRAFQDAVGSGRTLMIGDGERGTVESSSLSDLGIVGCKSAAAVHFSPPSRPIAGLWAFEFGKNCPRWGRFSLSTP